MVSSRVGKMKGMAVGKEGWWFVVRGAKHGRGLQPREAGNEAEGSRLVRDEAAGEASLASVVYLGIYCVSTVSLSHTPLVEWPICAARLAARHATTAHGNHHASIIDCPAREGH